MDKSTYHSVSKQILFVSKHPFLEPFFFLFRCTRATSLLALMICSDHILHAMSNKEGVTFLCGSELHESCSFCFSCSLLALCTFAVVHLTHFFQPVQKMVNMCQLVQTSSLCLYILFYSLLEWMTFLACWVLLLAKSDFELAYDKFTIVIELVDLLLLSYHLM